MNVEAHNWPIILNEIGVQVHLKSFKFLHGMFYLMFDVIISHISFYSRNKNTKTNGVVF